MTNFYTKITFLFLLLSTTIYAQQLPNNQFEDWSGPAFDGVAQPASWHYSNVTQLGFEFNFAHQEAGRNGGYCMMVQDQDLKVAGIGETSPGYVTLGQPWVYVESLTKVSEATAGTYGGVAWTYRPDTMAVWIKRTGAKAMAEDFHLLYYAWTGTSYGEKYKGKNGNCTAVAWSDEESDIRQSTNGNECGTTTRANQIAEGWMYGRAIYNEWTQIKVPIFYVDNTIPAKMNVIFSASNYPNFRANDGLYAGNSLYIDDVQLIYSSKIDQLIIGGDEWKAFNPHSTAIQTYILDDQVTTLPSIKAIRGAGKLTNSNGVVTTFRGRKLEGEEITIVPGEIDKTPTLITVKAEDGSSETTYKILFSHTLSNNAYLGGILVNGQQVKGFSPYSFDYTAEVEFGSTQAPVISIIKQEEEQQVVFTQPSSLDDVTRINVTAADGQAKKTYTVRYKQAALNDNTLQDILVNGTSVPGFAPNKTNYRVSIPIGTTQMPVVTPISKYAEGLQTIVTTPPSVIDGGVYKITVSSPGNPSPKEYRLTFAVEVSSYCKLNNIYLDGVGLDGFSADNTSYSISLPIGTTTLPVITWEQGDPYQTVELFKGGLEGTTRIVVTAANGDQLTYRLNFSTSKSTINTLDGILLDGEMISGFDKNITSYYVQLPIGTTSLPNIQAVKGDPYQQITMTLGGLNGTTRITVVAENGNTKIYQITFSVDQATDASLLGISVGGMPLAGFDPEILEYDYLLPQGTTQLPTVEYVAHDIYQTITTRSDGVNGDYRITVRPQSGASRTYVIHFSVEKSSNSALKMIYIDGDSLAQFDPEQLDYVDTLETTHIPNVTYDAEPNQKILTLFNDNVYTIKVTAEDGSNRTYSITFVVRVSKNAFLKMIYLDGDSLKGFLPERMSYSNLPIQNHICPIVTVDSEQGQQVAILAPYSTGTANIIVTAESGDNNTYLLEFIDTTTTPVHPLDPTPEYIPSTDATLRAILFNNDTLSNYSPAQTTYTLDLPAGDTIPVVTFVPNTDKQAVISGRISSNQYAAFVTAENGDTTRYVVTVFIAPRDLALLKDLSIQGQSIEFDPNTFAYNLSLTEGDTLPIVEFQAEDGASTLFNTLDANHQQIIVTSESGKQNTYLITYTREESNYALLSDIQIDGQSLSHFDANQFTYTDTLAWRSKVVPVVNAIPGHDRQTITTAFSAVNGVTRIHVVAADGVHTADYSIAFPVYKSHNVALNTIQLQADYSIKFNFDATQNDYIVMVPYNATSSPVIQYEKAEKEQSISCVLRPIGQKNEIMVEAENGDKRTYSITFQRDSTPSNQLKTIQYVLNNQDIHELALQENQYEYTIDLPYGTNSMDISYMKAFDEQTVIVQPGGIYNPTILTVYNHLLSDQPAVYQILPALPAFRPASLNSITVDDITISDFDPNQLSYIVNRNNTSNVPSVSVTKASSVSATQETDLWQSTITTICEEDTTIYHLYFHYPSDTIPNGEFTEWKKTKVSNSDKPTSWNVPGDYLGTYALTAKAGEAISKSDNSIVRFTTVYWGALYGAVPPVINLASMTANFAVAGGTTVTPSGTNRFYNSPDQAIINYKYPNKAGEGALFRFRFADFNDITDIDHWQKSETKSFADYTVNLNTNGKNITGLDIIVDATGKYPKAPTGPTTDCSSELDLDYIRFSYNNILTRVRVNGKEAAREGDNFSHTLSSSLDIAIPMLQFEGEVIDQAQKVTWQVPVAEGEYSVRRATITNYGEDGNYSTYALEVKRPLDTQVALKTIQIGNLPLQGFNANQLEYTYTMPYGTLALPDVVPVLNNKLQTCSTNLNDSSVIIKITCEKGETRTYQIHFVQEGATNNTLQNIEAGDLLFDAEQTSYTIEGEDMPAISITKRHDEQTVTVSNGQVDVYMPGLATTHYTINLHQDTVITSGKLKELKLDGDVLADFHSDTYTYEHAIPSTMSFTRVDENDSVVYVRKCDTLRWYVYGSESHTYQITKPDYFANSTSLQGIYLNGELVEGFLPQIDSYEIYTDSAVQLSIVGADSRQKIDIQHQSSTYTITVTSPNGSSSATYTLSILPTTSSDARLAAIYVDGNLLDSFQPDQRQYTIELPLEGAYKDHEPVIPTINFVTMHPKASVEIEANKLGESTNLFVSSQDGMQKQTYELLVKAEPSHNAELSAIAINDVPLADFQSDRLFYFYSTKTPSAPIQLDWRSLDRYQTITSYCKDNKHIIHVVAQDGYTQNDYTIEIHSEKLSNDATLANIMLDGMDMSKYYVELNQDLSFDPGLNKYKVYIPSHLANLPNVSATLKMEGQTIHMKQDKNSISLIVTAPDNTTQNTYMLQFIEVLSNNTALKGIILDTTAMDSFNPDTMFYYITLPIGQHDIPDVTPIKEQQTQNVEVSTSSLPIGQQTLIDVTAEDGITAAQYRLIFQLLPSEADSLLMIYADGDSLAGFSPQTRQYTFEVDREASAFPILSWKEVDSYQTIVVDTLVNTSMMLMLDIKVIAESGKTGHYQVTYFKQLSTNTVLRNIFVNNQPLNNFDSLINEYIITLNRGETIDTIAWEEADKYQMISLYDTISSLIPNAIATKQIRVVAENGDTRIYTLCFVEALSTDSTLSMIYYNGTPVSEYFDELLADYSIQFTQHGATLPLITYTKKEPQQQVDIQIIDSLHVNLYVTSEDSLHHFTYELTFNPYLSDNSFLDTLYVQHDVLTPEFSATTTDYDLQVDSIQNLPKICYRLAEPDYQQLRIESHTDTTNVGIYVIYTYTVIAESQKDSTEYTLKIYITSSRPRTPEDSENARLSAIDVKGQLLSTAIGFDQNFSPDTIDYHFLFPIGANPESFYTVNDFIATAEDSLAKVQYSADTLRLISDTSTINSQLVAVKTCTHITVIAPAGNSRTYNIYQELALDSTNHVTDLLIADKNGNLQSLSGFSSDVYYYEYTLSETASNAPHFVLRYENTSSRFACIRYDYSNDSRIVNGDDQINYASDNSESDPTYRIYYRAENGKRYTYKIKFRRSEIQRALKPLEGDVLIQPIPGTTQIAVASLRSNVVFGLYDLSGHMVELVKLPEGNPNSFATTTDGFGQTYFGHLTDFSSCTILTLEPNKLYLWVFTENGKRKIKAGKITILP